MFSYWEKDITGSFDIIITGAGICGFSLAASLMEHNAQLKICVIDRSPLGWGASTRNAGFACFGSLTEILSDIELQGVDRTVQLVESRMRGLQKLQNRMHSKDIGLEKWGGYELVCEKDITCLQHIDSVNLLLKDIIGENVFQLRTDSISDFGFNKDLVNHLIYSPYEAQIHSGKMMKALQDYVVQLGVTVLRGYEVIEFVTNEKNAEIAVKNVYNGSLYTMQCTELVFANNAEIANFFTDCGIKPGRGQVLITHEIPALAWKGIFHYDEGFYYFRNVNKRILFGGGRNLDFERECSYSFELNDDIQADLEKKLREMIIPDLPFEIDMRWCGIMAFTEDKLPKIHISDNHVHYICTCNGMGVALASEVSEKASKKLLEILELA